MRLNKRTTYVIASLLLIFSLASIGVSKMPHHFMIAADSVTGKIRNVDYIYSATGEGYLQACNVICDTTPKDAKVMLIFEHRGLYIPRRHVIGTPYFQSKYFTDADSSLTPENIRATLKAEGISYVLVGLSSNDPDRIGKYLEKSQKFATMLQALVDRQDLKIVWSGSGYMLYRVETY